MRKKKISVIIILIVILISFLSGCFENDEEDEIHDFVFTGLDSSEKHLSDYRGKIVILDMWATWCGPCMAVMPELKKIYENYSRDDLEILSINIDPSESIQLIQSYRAWFAEEYGIELDWVFGMDDGSISEKYMKEGAIPTVAIFDQKGRLHFRKAGICAYTEIPLGFPEDTSLLAPVLNELIN